MADQTGADVWIVWYKLFPKTTGKELIESIIDVYKEALRLYDAKDIAFFGLSSGGSLCLDICTYITEHKLGFPLPGKLLPINATVEQSINFGNCCIGARKAHTSISDVCRTANSPCFSAVLFERLKINLL